MIPGLHVVTDDEVLRRGNFLSAAETVLQEGGEDVALHLRGPGTGGRVLFSLGAALMDLAGSTGSRILANDRVDLALALGLPGAHLGQRSIPPESARSILGPGSLVGLSVHGPGEARSRYDEVLDYLFVGAVFATTSHPGQAPVGTEMLQEIRGVTTLPLVGIGGIRPSRVSEVLAAGAVGVAVLGGVWNAEDPGAATRHYLDELEKGKGA